MFRHKQTCKPLIVYSSIFLFLFRLSRFVSTSVRPSVGKEVTHQWKLTIVFSLAAQSPSLLEQWCRNNKRTQHLRVSAEAASDPYQVAPSAHPLSLSVAKVCMVAFRFNPLGLFRVCCLNLQMQLRWYIENPATRTGRCPVGCWNGGRRGGRLLSVLFLFFIPVGAFVELTLFLLFKCFFYFSII